MLDVIMDNKSMDYMTAVSDTTKLIKQFEEAGWGPKMILRHLKQCGRSADLAIECMLRDMETRDLAAKASSPMRRMPPQP